MFTRLANLLFNIDDWFAKRNIYFDFGAKDKDNHVNFLCRLGIWLMTKPDKY